MLSQLSSLFDMITMCGGEAPAMVQPFDNAYILTLTLTGHTNNTLTSLF